MPALRAALGAIGLLALILAAWMVYLRAPVAAVFWLCVIGAVLVFAALFERCGGDWAKFYLAVKKIGNESPDLRKAFLAGTRSDATP